MTIKEVSVRDLATQLEADGSFPLVDVREPFERDICEIGGINIPLKELVARAGEIPRDRQVVVYCRSGGRSAKAVEELQTKHGFDNLVNLKGGILAWIDEIDPSLQKY